jgi:hypothetical protein
MSQQFITMLSQPALEHIARLTSALSRLRSDWLGIQPPDVVELTTPTGQLVGTLRWQGTQQGYAFMAAAHTVEDEDAMAFRKA